MLFIQNFQPIHCPNGIDIRMNSTDKKCMDYSCGYTVDQHEMK